MTSPDNRGSKPAFTSEDLPHPDGPYIRPTSNVLSGSVSSMRVFQKRMLSGSPSRSRGPGSNSRKKSASCASNDRSPFGTILTAWLSEVGVVAVGEEVPDGLDVTAMDEGCTTGTSEGEPALLRTGTTCRLSDCSAKKCRRSSAMSLAVV